MKDDTQHTLYRTRQGKHPHLIQTTNGKIFSRIYFSFKHCMQ